MSDKRAKPRFGPLLIKVRVTVSDRRFDAYLTNVSTTGAFLATDEPPEVGSELTLRAVLPWKLGELSTSARVVWRKASEDDPENVPVLGAGIAFTGVDEVSLARLEAYLARFAELAAKIDADEELGAGPMTPTPRGR